MKKTKQKVKLSDSLRAWIKSTKGYIKQCRIATTSDIESIRHEKKNIKLSKDRIAVDIESVRIHNQMIKKAEKQMAEVIERGY